MSEWKKARKKPVEIEYREVKPTMKVCDGEGKQITLRGKPLFGEEIHTHEGNLIALCDYEYVIKGVEGELYPIKKDIFAKTYDLLENVNSDGIEGLDKEALYR